VSLLAFRAGAQTLPDAPGKETFVMVCSMCHSPTAVIGKQGTKQWWQAKVTEMLQEVTDVPDSDVDTIVAYLAKNFPIVKINVNKASAKDLETGLELTAKESEAIVQYRDAKGNFKTLDDLKKVPGLDAVKIESKKDRLEF
jgi:competence protein ComEA